MSHVFFVESTLRRTLLRQAISGVRRPILTHSEKARPTCGNGCARVAGRPGVCMAQSVGAVVSREYRVADCRLPHALALSDEDMLSVAQLLSVVRPLAAAQYSNRQHRGASSESHVDFLYSERLWIGRITGPADPRDAVVRSGRAPPLHHHNERYDGATEQDQADVARRAVRHDGLALDLPRVHRGGHGASGLRYPVHRHAA